MNRKFIALALLLVSACSSDDQPQHHSGRPIDKWPEGAVLLLDDHQGSVVAEVDAYGRPVANTAYHPYGAVRANSGSPSPYGYVGNERDVGTGLGDFHARQYRYDTGTFLSVDPQALFPRPNAATIDASLGSYSYSQGNPVVLSDPNGNCPICVVILIGLGAGMATASPANTPKSEHSYLYSPTPMWKTGGYAAVGAGAGLLGRMVSGAAAEQMSPWLARGIGNAVTDASGGLGIQGIEDISNGHVSSPGTYLRAAGASIGFGMLLRVPRQAMIIARAVAPEAGEIAVIGRQFDTAVAADWPGHSALELDPKIWNTDVNDAWIKTIIDRRVKVYLASPLTPENLAHPTGEPTVFGTEVRQLRAAGYVKQGDYLLPPERK